MIIAYELEECNLHKSIKLSLGQTVPANALASSPTTVGGGPPSPVGMRDAFPKSTTEVEVSPIASELSTGSHTPVQGRRRWISSAVSVGGVETGVSGKVRRWWGQDLKVHTALRLWHLRSWLGPQVTQDMSLPDRGGCLLGAGHGTGNLDTSE